MDNKSELKKRYEFREILIDLAKQQDLLKNLSTCGNFYNRLEMLYYNENSEECFRHFYSDIFSILTQIQQDEKLGDINILAQNLNVIKDTYQAVNYDSNNNLINIGDRIKKLYDHVNLDVARLSYLDEVYRKNSGEETRIDILNQVNLIKDIQKEISNIKTEQKSVEDSIKEFESKMEKLQSGIDTTKVEQESLEDSIEGLRKGINTTRKEQESLEETIKNQEKEYIAILGIFSSAVLTFVGGIAFSSSVLNNIANVGIYRLLITSIVVGAVVLNILFGLFFYLEKLIYNKNGSYKPVLIANGVILIILFAICICWYTGFVENRNAKIESEVSETLTVTTPIESILSTELQIYENIDSYTNQSESDTIISDNLDNNETGS